MRDRLKELLNNSYAPYSNFRVSAVVVMKDGTIQCKLFEMNQLNHFLKEKVHKHLLS